MPSNRFVILHHLTAGGEHWDLMLEQEDGLLTWQMLAEPRGRDAFPVDCIRISDHRKFYLDYEGPVSGGRGVVSRFDHGTYERLSADEQTWTIVLNGQRLRGQFVLARTGLDDESHWTCQAM